jgi:hypothetical protein
MATNGNRYPRDENAPMRNTEYVDAMTLIAEGLVKIGNRMDETDYQMRKAQYERDSHLAELIELRQEAGQADD